MKAVFFLILALSLAYLQAQFQAPNRLTVYSSYAYDGDTYLRYDSTYGYELFIGRDLNIPDALIAQLQKTEMVFIPMSGRAPRVFRGLHLLPNVKSVRISGYSETRRQPLGYNYPHVDSLETFLMEVFQMPHLSELYLIYMGVETLPESIVVSDKLTFLSLRCNRLKDVSCLSKLKSLETLDLCGNEVSADSFLGFVELTSLRYLCLGMDKSTSEYQKIKLCLNSMCEVD